MGRKLILYIAMSLDGYIAGNDDDLGFLSVADTPGEDYGYADFMQQVDTVIWGRRTFDKVLTFGEGVPHRDKRVYVISRSRQGRAEHAEYAADVVALVKTLKAQEGKDIYCDGGADIVYTLLRHRLFDRLIVSIIPHMVGEGIRLFKDHNLAHTLKLKRSMTYPSGLVQLWYDVQHNDETDAS